MNRASVLLLLVVTSSLALNGCGPIPPSTATPESPTLALVPPTAIAAPPSPTSTSPTPTLAPPALSPVPPLPTPLPQGKTTVVQTTADIGPGTLRQALLDAQSSDIIIFDPVAFPPTAPATIYVDSVLPPVSQSHLTVDASNTGVILDGSGIPEGWNGGIEIYSSSNTIRGLQVVGFSGAGIAIGSGQNNLVAGNISCGNDFGIGLWGTETSNNTIAGNYLGILADGTTPRGNKSAGIAIMEGANGNFIGPDNRIAFNGHSGIEILNANSTGNTISQNRVHDNGMGSVSLWDGGNTELTSPAILDFDLSAGTVSGTACAGCTVEIFSDSSDSGGIYEGRTTADSNGSFMLNKDASFTGPHLAATATDADGNTSQFSALTSGMSRSLILQEGNDLLRTLVKTKQSGELEDNRIGSVGLDDGPLPSGELVDLQGVVSEVVNMGLKHLRFTITRIDGDRVDWDKPEYTVEPRHHAFLASMAENGVMVKLLLIFRDDVLGGEGRPYHPRFQTEEEIQRYLDYVRIIVGNVKGRVPYYEIWNEPNIGDSVQWIEVEDYISLVKRVVPVIRQEDPQAKIVLAGTTYLREPESRDYLFSILRSDVMPLVDAVSWHPLYAASPEFHSDYYYEYPAIVQQIKDTASAHGFTGEYVAGEITWRTGPESGAQDWGISYSETIAAKYHARGTVMHLGVDVRVTNNAVPSGLPSRQLVDTAITNLCTVMAGAEATSLPVEVETEATNVVSYSFSLPNGDYLIAIWTDGVALEDDPGITATLILPGLSPREVVGLDVLYGLEQQMISDSEDGTLVIRDLLVKDYPIILRFADAASP